MRSLGRGARALAAAAAALVWACDAAPGAAPPIPADHPCPAWALPPAEAASWWDLAVAGTPAPIALALPLPPGLAAPVSQGNLQGPTHEGDNAWAWDFAVPVGTPVHAAAAGVVVEVRDDSTRFGPEATYRDAANLVVVDHGGGLFTAYVHLAAGAARVAPGDAVAAGAVLSETGLSGQLTGPHLHFQLENVWSQSLPARFVAPGGAEGCGLWPDTGDVVTAGERDSASLAAWASASAMPEDAWAEDGLLATRGLPARLLERGRRYGVSGVASPDATDVVFLMLPPAGGAAVASWRFPVGAGGSFSGGVDLRGLPSGRYGLGAVAVEPSGAVFVDAAVRVTVR